MLTKRFVPCIYLYEGKAVKGFKDSTVVAEEPVSLARSFCENDADALMVFDLSSQDEKHEKALDILKDICAAVEVDVYGAGNVKRMEDIKKILYTGCKKAILDYQLDSNIVLTEEVSLKFGKDKLIALSNKADVLIAQKQLLEQYVCEILLTEEAYTEVLKAQLDLPCYLFVSNLNMDKVLDCFRQENVCGITGNALNESTDKIIAMKDICVSNGLQIVRLQASFPWSAYKKNSDGMVPVVVQDYRTLEVLMVAYMNEEAYELSIKTGKMTYYSRSRNELWLKGATSGHYQYIKSLSADCDMDTILAKVSQVGAACHTGAKSCFFNQVAKKDYELADNPLQVFEEVLNVIKDRKIHPKEGSYTNYLFDKGIDKILKKLGEEATEIVIAAKNPNANEVKYEISDFLYHMMVLMVEKDVSWEEITTELANR